MNVWETVGLCICLLATCWLIDDWRYKRYGGFSMGLFAVLWAVFAYFVSN